MGWHVQVGSLIVGLPSIHEGGQLTVKHGRRKQDFDWSLSALLHEPMVQWGAFYSDCAQEMHEVERGVHITVVYNIMAIPTSVPYLKVGSSRHFAQAA